MRYIVLILLNAPIILIALVDFVARYKMKKITKERFRSQLFVWIAVLIVLIGSFPVYNYISGRPPLDSHELSLFDIVQTTAIILLFYVVNSQRQKIERNDKRLRDLHQELSIKLSR